MREFFRGWRRKLGCVALVIACALCTMWLRSVHTADGMVVAFGPTFYEARSERGGVELMIHEVFSVHPEQFGLDQSRVYSQKLVPIVVREDGYYEVVEETGYNWCHNHQPLFGGFIFSCHELDDGFSEGRIESKVIGFPYWFVTIPMTLLSAYLVLCKSRKTAVTTTNVEVRHA